MWIKNWAAKLDKYFTYFRLRQLLKTISNSKGLHEST
jgi:hypothetical protein